LEGAAIAQFALSKQDEAVWMGDEPGDGEAPSGRPLAVLGVSIAALALAALPAGVGMAVIFGSTLPLEFAAAAALAILASIKLAAAGAGLAVAIRSRW
jgi:hypothetical protein